jgi:hypothetical protein
MSADGEDRQDLGMGGPEEELRRMGTRRRGARTIGREQAIPILFVVLAGVLLLWWLIGLRGPGSQPQAVVPTLTVVAPAVSTPTISLTVVAPAVAVGTGTAVTGGTVPPPVPTPGTPISSSIAIDSYVKVVGTGADQLSFRFGPGLNYARVSLLPDDTLLKVVGGPEEADCGQPQLCRWWRLQTQDGTVGWAIENNLVPTTPP